MQTENLPPALQAFAQLVNDQPEEVRELFHYALTMLMVEDGKAKIVQTHRVDNLEYLTIETTVGDVFEILKPQVSENLLGKTRELAREVMRQDRESGEVE